MDYETYETPDDLKEFLEEVVNNPFRNHTHTEAWECEVLNQDSHYHTKQILERGRAHFNTDPDGLTSHDKVIIYCYYYMQMHIVSSFHVFKKSDSLLKEYIRDPNKNIVFIDFGCGPLTSGVALAGYYRSLDKDKQLDFHYIGIDNSEAMICKATEISQLQAWRGCTFKFLESYEDHVYILNLIAIAFLRKMRYSRALGMGYRA